MARELSEEVKKRLAEIDRLAIEEPTAFLEKQRKRTSESIESAGGSVKDVLGEVGRRYQTQDLIGSGVESSVLESKKIQRQSDETISRQELALKQRKFNILYNTYYERLVKATGNIGQAQREAYNLVLQDMEDEFNVGQAEKRRSVETQKQDLADRYGYLRGEIEQKYQPNLTDLYRNALYRSAFGLAAAGGAYAFLKRKDAKPKTAADAIDYGEKYGFGLRPDAVDGIEPGPGKFGTDYNKYPAGVFPETPTRQQFYENYPDYGYSPYRRAY